MACFPLLGSPNHRSGVLLGPFRLRSARIGQRRPRGGWRLPVGELRRNLQHRQPFCSVWGPSRLGEWGSASGCPYGPIRLPAIRDSRPETGPKMQSPCQMVRMGQAGEFSRHFGTILGWSFRLFRTSWQPKSPVRRAVGAVPLSIRQDRAATFPGRQECRR